MEHYCYHCMTPINPKDEYCPLCGKKAKEVPSHHLQPGTKLADRFVVGYALGEGGFGITYIGKDIKLDMKIAIKEFFPNGFVNRNNTLSMWVNDSVTQDRKEFFEKGKERFLLEARILAKFSGQPGIVDVRDFFEENNTAYIVMEFLDGITLKNHVIQKGLLTPEEAITMLTPVMNALKKVHAKGLIHRDISPDNIMLVDDTVKLLDFGAARDVSGSGNHSLSVLLKPGYAPEEQYRTRGEQGPWTDVYALCATIYKCISGVTPDDATQRLFRDELKAPSALGVAISPALEQVLLKGMEVRQFDRYQSVDELLEQLESALATAPVVPPAPTTQPTPPLEATVAVNHAPQREVPPPPKTDPTLAVNHAPKTQEPQKELLPPPEPEEWEEWDESNDSGMLCPACGKWVEKEPICPVCGTPLTDKEEFGEEESLHEGSPDHAQTEGKKDRVSLICGFIFLGVLSLFVFLVFYAVVNENPSDYTPISDNIYDFEFSINNKKYQFPMEFSALSADGWSYPYSQSSVAPNSTEVIDVTNQKGHTLQVTFKNTDDYEKAPSSCNIVAISCDGKENKYNGLKFSLAKGISLSSTKLEIQPAWGEPTVSTQKDSVETFSYYAEKDDPHRYISFSFSYNSSTSGDVTITLYYDPPSYDMATLDKPGLLYSYQAPTQIGEFNSGVVRLQEKLYRLPAPLSEFLDDGWQITGAVREKDAQTVTDPVSPDETRSLVLAKSGCQATVMVQNFSTQETVLKHCAVTILTANNHIQIGNITIGTSKDYVETTQLADHRESHGEDWVYTMGTAYVITENQVDVKIRVNHYTQTVTEISLSQIAWVHSQ